MPFTTEQEKAIQDQGRDILVSASAGSGKTTVLVERVLREIMNGKSVDELLIVTFTKAAAEEMKNRIKLELTKTLRENISSQKRNYLRQQLNNIDTANISTIDAFCLEVIHRFYYAVDLDPSFSILTDDTQAVLLKEQALHEIESEHLEAQDQDFLTFYDNFAGDRDAESARDLLLDLYNFAMAKPNYRSWLKELTQDYEIGEDLISSDLWKKKIKDYLLNVINSIKGQLKTITSTSQFESDELEKLRTQFLKFRQNLDNFAEVVQNDASYNTQRDMIRVCVFEGSLRPGQKWDEDIREVYEEAKNVRGSIQSQIYDMFTAFFVTDEDEQIEVIKKSQKIMAAIVDAELALIDRFSELKRKQNLLDYTDMEQLAYQILSQDTSNSQLARDFYQNKFTEILIDEYQDINPLQENIIQLLKKDGKNNIFMVGDVKQSIYGFRQAEPSLFLKKYHAFGNDDSQNERILLSDNFRSTKPVTQVVNSLFKQILTTDFGGIDYEKEGQLIFGAEYYPKNLAQSAEILYHKKDKKEDFSEIEMVINRIRQFKKEKLEVYDSKLGHKRPFKYSDIAILTRSRSNNLQIMQEFGKADIPLFITDAENYFQTFELTVIMNYLKIIDNPDQDIPLVAVLRSPLFNFSESDFAKIRIKSKNTSFYSALTGYVSKNDELAKKIKVFLNQLEELRDFSATHRISELIWSIYAKTNLLEIMTALPNGEQRRVNLEALYERATSYESAGFKGLYQFINFIERIRRSQKDLSQPLLTKDAGDSVRLMTIHGSKGLEFPIVFYLGVEKKYQMSDLRGNYVINSDEVGLTLRKSNYRIDSLIKSYGNVEKKRQLLEEEARIFYVALTRAKQKLILVTDISSFDKKIAAWQEVNSKTLAYKLSVTNPLEFIGPSLKFNQHISQKLEDITNSIDETSQVLYIDYAGYEVQEDLEDTETAEEDQNYALLTKTTKKLYDFKYPFKDASQTTAYQAVSEIKKAFNDPLESELENSRLVSSSNRYLQPIDTKPNFLFETNFTGAEIGTATHLVLQYYDYTGEGDEQQLDNELEELIAKKKLNAEIVPSLKKDQIEWFVHSDFAQKFWQKPNNLKREEDFSSLISASKLFDNFSDKNAKILVHGTIDGYFIDNDGIVLFDYKTDHVDQKHLDLAINNIKQKYTGQLRLYEQALNSFSNKKVKGKYLILLDAKKIVEVK